MAELYASANGIRVTAADILVPYYGAPVADLTFPSDVTLVAPVTLTIANYTQRCGILRQRSFAGGARARLIGGAATWGREVAFAPFANPAGVLLSLVLRTLAAATGSDATTRERVSLPAAADRNLGQFYVPGRAEAGLILRRLAGRLWWVDAAGVTQVGASARPTTTIKTEARIQELDGARGLVEVGTEDVAAWMPGARYSGVTVPQPFTVSATQIKTGNDGILRVEVLTS